MRKPRPEIRSDKFNGRTVQTINILNNMMGNSQRDALEEIVESIYKEAYVDGFADCLWYLDGTDIY